MLVTYSILFILYISLALLYFFTRKDPVHIPSWPLLNYDNQTEFKVIECDHQADCPSQHVCLNKQCVPTFLKEGSCNAQTGHWEAMDVQGRLFAICKCTNEKLFAQPVFGADCTLSVACGVHGKYNITEKKCICDPGYTEKDLRCRKMSVLEYQRTQPCASNETRVSELRKRNPKDSPFHQDYLDTLENEDCVKNPCSFDSLTGRTLKSDSAYYKQDWGCVCDPSYGVFGVQLLKNNRPYLKENDGFDACASIFNEDPKDPIDVKLITYFYIKDRDPLSIILFESLPEDRLHSLFKNRGGQFMLSHTLWRYDFAQHFFSKHPIPARLRLEDEPKSYRSVDRYYFEFYSDFHPQKCTEYMDNDMNLRMTHLVLYGQPVCLAPDNDPLYGKRYIVRPEHIFFQKYTDDTPRYNAFVLEYEMHAKRWSLDLDYPYNVDYYRELAKNGQLQKIPWYAP